MQRYSGIEAAHVLHIALLYPAVFSIDCIVGFSITRRFTVIVCGVVTLAGPGASPFTFCSLFLLSTECCIYKHDSAYLLHVQIGDH